MGTRTAKAMDFLPMGLIIAILRLPVIMALTLIAGIRLVNNVHNHLLRSRRDTYVE